MTGRRGANTMEMNGRSTPVPLIFVYLNRSGNKGAFRIPGATWHHFHCTVEPSPRHIRCQAKEASSWILVLKALREGRQLLQDLP